MISNMTKTIKPKVISQQELDGKLTIVSGSSRCGKTEKTFRLVRPFETVFVWDIEAQWCKRKGYKKITSLVDLKKIVRAGTRGRYAYVSAGNIKAEFELFCMCVSYYGNFYGVCAVVAEELGDVTSIAKAGDCWGMLVRRGLKRGINIFAISQRWQEADKTAFGNATDYYIFMQSSLDDARYMSKKTSIDLERIWSLNKLEYLHFQKEGKLLEGGKVTF